MTIGTILPAVLVHCGINKSNPTINEDSFEMRQMRYLMDEAGRDINARFEWAKACKSHVEINIQSDPLPDDFLRMRERGAVTIGGEEFTPAIPVVAPEMWALVEKSPPDTPHYHMRDGYIYYSQIIGSLGVEIRYITKNWAGTADVITSNDDVPVFPDHLLILSTVWRFRRQKGLPYEDIMAESEAVIQTAIKADRGA